MKEKVYLPRQNFRSKTVFYRTEIHKTVLKQSIRFGFLIKQRPKGVLADKEEHTKRSQRRGR